ncbi:MAG: menaquinol oxidoreductase [Deltaproteobacteria bacterium RIFOXYA12_FULL_58_15]|nr:MAG: menaquinol oxidoreductase [Deltaproteobacteria bacterium RIFOXYA12_FULL_58_15]OGR09562.1 MAG: menaquinol oxidoreductase [Deltaproteobacteria bacterium RIFOXYB12_FULL_58_9]
MAAPKFDEIGFYDKSKLLDFSHSPKAGDWLDPKTDFRDGSWIYPTKAKHLEYLKMPNPREWNPKDEDWALPDNWKEIVIEGFRERLHKYRSLKVFMDICVRCGACADKCHFFIGGGDPKNMPVLRAELLRSIYRGEIKTMTKILGKLAGGRKLTKETIKEWFYYFYQCTECRRCSVFCPYGIDTAEITMMARELLHLLGLGVNWAMEPVAACYRTGNHLGIQPHGVKDTLEFFADDIEEATGVKVDIPINQVGADVLFVTPSGDFLADPGTYTCMGYMTLFHYLKEKYGFTYTWSTYASEGGNFGLFTSAEMMKRLNSKIYAEAKRLGVKYIIGGECGHMWRVLHQYMDTMNGPADFLEVPKNPITGTVFENAKSTKMIHICEFTADLIKHGKLKLDPSRNAGWNVTFHDSCNPARSMGFFEEPRYIIKNVVPEFHEMPENTIREQTFCCGGGAGLGTDEFMEMRLRGGMPRGNAVNYVKEKFGVNKLAAICAIDRATLQTVCEYWAPGVTVTGVHEMVANALVLDGEKEREVNFRMEPLPGKEGSDV